MTVFRGGKLPPDPSRPRLKLAPFIDTAAVISQHPDLRDWLTAAGPYPMAGNDAYGDCVFADQAHEIQALTAYATGVPTVFTSDQVLGQYHDVTGFDPADPSTDQGAVIQDALDFWRKHGFPAASTSPHTIAVFAQVDHTSMDEVIAAIDLFGAVSVGLQVPDYAMDQFDQGEPWTVQVGGKILGGHAVHGGAYSRTAKTIEVVTWGAVQTVTWAFWSRYVDECWVKIPTKDWFGSSGRSPSGLDLHGLGEQFASLTGDPNPFPAPTPQPVPVPPTPDPVDTPSAADLKLWAQVQRWAGHPHLMPTARTVARDLLQWAAAKGLHPGGG